MNGEVLIWSTDNWSLVKDLKGQHTHMIRSLTFNKNNILATGSDADKSINVWNTDTWVLIKKIEIEQIIAVNEPQLENDIEP